MGGAGLVACHSPRPAYMVHTASPAPDASPETAPAEGDASAAARVLTLASDALARLRDGLDGRFSEAVDAMLATKGRVIVSGMGKSGHVARKIAATLASTGTPAHFVHPAEASHGDLGMMAQGDVALVLSNSGETPELADLVAYTRRFNIPLIGVASRADSTLIKQSDIGLILPKAQEACWTRPKASSAVARSIRWRTLRSTVPISSMPSKRA